LKRWWGVFPSLKEIKDNLKKFYKKDCRHLTLTGGEPTLNKDIFSILKYAKTQGYITYLTTNGKGFVDVDFTKEALSLLDELCISVHGNNAKLHNLHTCNQESFDILKKALENIKKFNQKTKIFANCVVTKYNFPFLEDIFKFLVEFVEAEHILFSNFSPEGKGYVNFEKLVVPLEEFKKKIPTIIELSKKYSKTVRFFGLPACIFGKDQKEYSNDFNWSKRITLEIRKRENKIQLFPIYSQLPTRKRIKLERCKDCMFDYFCGGVFEEFVRKKDIFSIIPVSEDEILKRKEEVATEKRLWIRLSWTCNNRCIFCLDADAQHGRFEKYEKIITKLKRGIKEGYRRVIFSGGEPTIHPQFLEIVKKAKEIGYTHIQIITNGRMFYYEDYLKKAVENGVKEITFSFHGHNSGLHDCQTQIKGSFIQSLKGLINALKIPDLIVSVDIVINGFNVKYLKDILDFFINLGVKEFDLLHVIPFGRAWKNWKIVNYDIEENLKTLREVFYLSKRKGITLWTNRFPPQFLEGFEELIQHPFKLYDEIKGREAIFNKFLRSKEIMNCFGERCIFCFLYNFCKDLQEFVERKILYSKEIPFCLRNEIKKKKRCLKFSSKITIFDFLEFYLKERYFIKGLRCRICRHYNECDGLSIYYIRKNGFAILKPIFNSEEIQPAFLSLPSSCDFKCIFCDNSTDVVESVYKKEEIFEKLERFIINLKNLGIKKILLSGNEALNFPYLIETIKLIKKYGFEEIILQTTGFKLREKNLCEKLVRAGITSFDLPIYASFASLHDEIVGRKGAFKALMDGWKNIEVYKNKISLKFHTIILKQNYLFLNKLIDFLKENGIPLKNFNILPLLSFSQDIEKYKKCSVPYKKIIEILSFWRWKKEEDIPLIEFPVCIVSKIIDNYDYKSPISKRIQIRFDNGMYFIDNFDREKGKNKLLDKCKKCKAEKFCLKPDPFYIKLYGDNDFIPLK
jgi:MoaA/NifB/PqqE/SkfB family radical SAM enzyme